MRRVAVIATGLALIVSPAAAYDPSLSAHESYSQQQANLAQGDALMRSSRQSVRRQGRQRVSSNRTAQTCANVPAARARHGANNPKVRKLAQLCRQAGY